MANGEPVLRGRFWKWSSGLALIAGFLLAWYGKDVQGFSLIAAVALGTGNMSTAAGRYNYRPPPVAYGVESDEP